MHGVSPTDPGRTIDWSRTSADYGAHRPGPPDSFFEKLRRLGIGLPGQALLDLGTGTGALARRFAAQGARVAGVDIAPGQIEEARRLAAAEGVHVDFRVDPAEATPFPDRGFDVLTANQCWLYFDQARAVAEARRLLAPGGVLVTSHCSWLPRQDPIARATEALVLAHNPQWTAGDWDGHVPERPAWAGRGLAVRDGFVYDEALPFTRESWRGRIRACRGVGAALARDDVQRFDAEHQALLARIAPERFGVLHRIDAHVLVPA